MSEVSIVLLVSLLWVGVQQMLAATKLAEKYLAVMASVATLWIVYVFALITAVGTSWFQQNIWLFANLQLALTAPALGIVWATVAVRIHAPAEESRLHDRIGLGFIMTLAWIGGASFFIFAADVFMGPSVDSYAIANNIVTYDGFGSVLYGGASLAYAALSAFIAFVATSAVRVVRRFVSTGYWQYSQ